MKTIRLVPESPDVMAELYAEYLRVCNGEGISFRQYLKVMEYNNPAEVIHGMDDGASFRSTENGLELISTPAQPVQGQLRVKVLLVDFSDQAGTLPISHYEQLLFLKESYPTGSMRDYYREVSLNKVDVTGSIHGWLRMPQPYSFYTNGQSGTLNTYPRNAQRMAEDAVKAARENDVTFDADLDLLNQGIITALFIIHAGRGAEELSPAIRGNHIWSHKWVMRDPVDVGNGLFASIYLTVPHDAKVGVCCHELGHLAFQWEDFYDPNYDRDGHEWDGSGKWDLMAGGSYNGGGRRPAHPAGLHKSQHNWIQVEEVKTSGSLTVDPYTKDAGKVVRLVSSKFRSNQYLLLENRAKFGFDSDLPGEGLLVWRVDESKQMFTPQRPALLLIQADGRHDLETPDDWNSGDGGDPFPGISGRTGLDDSGNISTSFPNGDNSGISLKNIQRNPSTGQITLDVVFEETGQPPVEPPTEDSVVRGETEPNLSIPDNDPHGVQSSLPISAQGAVGEVAVAVDIIHTYIGDLKVELIAPSGQKAILHNRTGGNTENLYGTYRSSSNDALAALADTSVSGEWKLRVLDLMGADTGVLKKWSIAIDLQESARSIRESRKPEIDIPDNDPSGVSSTIPVVQAGMIRSFEILVDVTHTYIGDLRVELINPQGESIILHNRTGGATKNLKKSFHSSDAPSLARFIGKSVRGDWSLRISDLEGKDRGVFKEWHLNIDLAPDLKVIEKQLSPNLTIPDNNHAGIGSNISISPSGTAQSIEVRAHISHTYIGDLRVELVAPSGERAVLHNRIGGRKRNLSLDLDSGSSSELASLIGQPIAGTWLLRIMDLEREDDGKLDFWSLKLFYIG